MYQRLGFGAENALWRNFYLTGHKELRDGITPSPLADIGAGMAGALTVEQLLDTLAIRVDGPRAASESMAIVWNFTDLGLTVRTALSSGALIQTHEPKSQVSADLTLTLTKPQLLGLLGGHGLDGIEHTGDPATLNRLLALLDTPDPAFPIVTPDGPDKRRHHTIRFGGPPTLPWSGLSTVHDQIGSIGGRRGARTSSDQGAA